MVKGISRIKYADSFLSESMVFKGGREEKKLPVIFAIYLIQTENRQILVDAGCETMPGFDMRNFISPAVALKEQTGLTPNDITDVVITHSHHDHIAAVGLLKNATVHIQKDEYESGRKYIPSGFKTETFDREKIIAENVRVIKIGGHSAGSCIVEIIFEGDTYIVCGDECYSRQNLTDKIPTGASNDPEKSKAFIEQYANSRYKTLLCHDL